jgi:hypothetical protein
MPELLALARGYRLVCVPSDVVIDAYVAETVRDQLARRIVST